LGIADMRLNVPISVGGRFFTRWDVLAVLLILGLLVFLAEASRHLLQPLSELQIRPVSLDPSNLPEYAARTTLRMLIAMVLSLLFTFTYATLAAKSKRAERLLVPLLDILQSVPILGFISITVVFFMALAPGRVLGAEFAAIFAIFTSQAWNMAFSFYQSLRTVPTELVEATRNFRLSPWMSFWRLDVPFAMPQLIWNMMMSMSGSWFFVVASEAISVGNTTITLPGVGSYIALAIEQRNLAAVGYAILTMLIVILIYDQVLFRPLVAWADRFRFEQEPGVIAPESWVLQVMRRSRLVDRLTQPFASTWRRLLVARWSKAAEPAKRAPEKPHGWITFQWIAIITVLTAVALWQVAEFVIRDITASDIATALLLGLATLSRIIVLIALASVIWVPIGVWVGTRPKVANFVQPVAQFLAAFPANLLFPIAVSAIVVLKLDPNIWLSPLMILGTQWYILFNVVAGASAIPAEPRSARANFHVRGLLWWRRIALPAVLPYYVTGAITASGGSWNASIVAEVASWGDEHLRAYGLGAYIAEQTEAGDFHRIVLGIAVMSLFVVFINRTFWRPLYLYAERKFRID
jgi:NitT/TauT family transport system permease protein